MNVVEIALPAERSRLCEHVLRDLPEWFGIEEATAAYIRDVAELATFAVDDVAFLALKVHNPRAAGFYEARGFVPLEELHGLGEQNPCLLLVKSL